MATSSEDILGELYGWDSTIDEMYERGVDHADFDEDDALEAYEEIIQVGAAPDQASDAVLSLAAQLLTKHFYKFPHVHRNIVDVLLALCAATRPQAVRIHSVRSLLQIVKSAQSTKPPLVAACRDRIGEVVAQLLQVEKSNVIVRHLTQLQDALVVVNGEVKKQEKKDKWVEKREQSKLKKEAEKKEKQLEKQLEKRDKADQELKTKDKSNDKSTKMDRKDEKKERDESRHGGREPEQNQQPNQKQNLKRSADAPLDGDDDRGLKRERRLSSGSLKNESNNNNNNHDAGCPPSAYIFVGSVPRGTDHSDIINYLSCIDESIDYHCVQIKYPNHGGRGPNSAGYAFVSLKSTDHARQAIRHIQTTEFNGRKLIGDFARGPHCATLQFVERDPALRMHDVGAFAVVDFTTLDASVWEELLSALKRYGSLDVVRVGCVRFRDLEHAKTVIRQNRIRVRGHDFLPVSDPEEQAAIDSAKRRPRSRSDVDGGGDNSRRGRGDQPSRYGGGGNGDHKQRGDRRDSQDLSRTSPTGDQREETTRRRRSPSIDRPARDEKPVRSDRQERRRNPQYGEFVPARYGPAPTSTKYGDNGARGQRERSQDAKRGGPDHGSPRRRSRSRSPNQRITGDQKMNGRNRSQSPVARRQAIENDRARLDDRERPREEMKHGSRTEAPPRSRHESPTRRGSRESTRRSPSPSTAARRDDSENSRRDADARLSPPRGRSRSPRRSGNSPSAPVDRRDKPNSRSRSQSPRPNDSERRRDAPLSRRKSDDRSVAEIAREEAERQRSLKQQRGRERERERNRERERGRQQENRRRDKTPSKMSKYGPGRGADRSPPPPPRARNEPVDGKRRSRSRDSGGNAARGRADDKPRRDEPSIPEPSSAAAAKRDRRASPPDDRNGRPAPENRSRSPPPRSPRLSPPPATRGPSVRARSPPRVVGQKRERSRSPQQQQRRDGAENRRPRVEDGSVADRGQEQRQPNRARSRSRSAEKRRAKMEDGPRGDANKNGERAPVREQRGQSPKKKDQGKEREAPIEKRRSPPPSPVRRDQRKRSESPVRSPRVKPVVSAAPAASASAPVAVNAKPSSASIYDIDECMVDYDEDDD